MIDRATSPEHLGYAEDGQVERRDSQAQEQPLQGDIGSPKAQQAVRGEAAAGQGGEGKTGGAVNPVHSPWDRYIHAAHQCGVLQPQGEGLHT